MKKVVFMVMVALCALGASLFVSALAAPEQKKPTAQELADMMAKMKRYTQPGKHHKILQRFIGKWNTETRLFLGGRATKADKGVTQTDWLMEGRWIQFFSKGKLMGKPYESFWIFGYDNFKKSYVATAVSSMDTAMIRSEGDMDPGGKTLLMYGTLDEYLTGEHDKMVKTVYRFVSDDKIVMEIHDLPIGEKNTKVVEIVFTRQ